MREINPTDFGALRRTTPVSGEFGFDRGRPIDRFYIEQFLDQHKSDIRGSVLEIGDRRYTKAFGADVLTSDVLDVAGGKSEATLVANLEDSGTVPLDRFDCIIFAQTLQYLYDLRAGLRSIHRMLRPGGVVLASFPGVSRTNDRSWGDPWYWNLTNRSARRLFTEFFSPDSMIVTGRGNVLACAASLFGLADWELDASELAVYDPGFEVVVTVRAEKTNSASDND